MARFEIEQYELHVTTYEVEASSAAKAIKRLFVGDGDMFDGSEYIGTYEQVGMNVEHDQELARQLRELGVKLRDKPLPRLFADGSRPSTQKTACPDLVLSDVCGRKTMQASARLCSQLQTRA